MASGLTFIEFLHGPEYFHSGRPVDMFSVSAKIAKQPLSHGNQQLKALRRVRFFKKIRFSKEPPS